MNIDNLELRINKKGTATYWKGDQMVMKQCTKCKEVKTIDNFSPNGKHLSGQCKKCSAERSNEWYSKNSEKAKERNKEYYKNNTEKVYECNKRWRINNREKANEISRNWYKNNPEKARETKARWRNKNLDYDRKRIENTIEKDIQAVINFLEQATPIFEKLNLPVYGTIYKIENIKTGHIYIGQTIRPLKRRYKNGIIKDWIKERKASDNQNFKDELIESDFIVTEILSKGYCMYHLDKLEAYWIDFYNSCNNGYNINAGSHNMEIGIEEFNQFLREYNLQFMNGQLINKQRNKELEIKEV